MVNKKNSTRKYNTVFYDMGHGGVDPNGDYTTAPSKMWKHPEGFHKNGEFYEGVKNRTYGNRVVQKLNEKGINTVVVNHPWLDTSLAHRVGIANYYHKNIAPGFYVSQHSNAVSSKKKATGTGVYTTRGANTSDVLAKQYEKMYAKTFPDTRLRKDKEANFYVIAKTVMSACLIENLFFDNIKDAQRLHTIEYWEGYTTMEADWIEWCLNYLSKHR